MPTDGKKRFLGKKITIEYIARAPAGLQNRPFRNLTGALPCHHKGFPTVRKSPYDTAGKAFRQPGKAQANRKTPHHTDSQRLGITTKKTTYLQPENLMDIKKALSRSMLRIIMHLQPIRCIYIQKPQTTESEAHSKLNRASVFIRISH